MFFNLFFNTMMNSWWTCPFAGIKYASKRTGSLTVHTSDRIVWILLILARTSDNGYVVVSTTSMIWNIVLFNYPMIIWIACCGNIDHYSLFEGWVALLTMLELLCYIIMSRYLRTYDIFIYTDLRSYTDHDIFFIYIHRLYVDIWLTSYNYVIKSSYCYIVWVCNDGCHWLKKKLDFVLRLQLPCK